jgi:hypothetical protein
LNFEEGKRFVRELIATFPAFETAAKDSPDLGATHRAWIKAWDDLLLDESMAVLEQLIRTGNIGWDDYRAPGPFIRRLVLAARRNAPKSEDELVRERLERNQRQHQQRQYVGSPMALALVHGLELKESGHPQEVVFAAMDRVLKTGKVNA